MNIFKYVRKYITFLIFPLIFIPSMSVFAIGDSWTSLESYTYFENHFDDINTRLNGVIINQNQLRESFEDYLEEYRDNYNIPSGTSTTTWIGDNISGSYQNGSSGIADLYFSQTFRQAMRDWCNTYLESNTGYKFGYTFTPTSILTQFDSQDQYHALLDVLNANQDKFIFMYQTNTIYVVDSPQFIYSSQNNGLGTYVVNLYENWQPGYTYTLYTWSTSGQIYSRGNSVHTDQLGSLNLSSFIGNSNAPFSNAIGISSNTQTYQVYMSLQALQNGSEGVQDYYITDSYNSTISGSFNTTTSDIGNTINSNNVNNYINNYYVQNGNYPTPTQIQIYINNYQPTPTPTPDGGGGGSGSGSDDDDNNNIWDFLDSIGEFLGHLISALGDTLSGILSLLTDVIDMFIGDNGLPNIISQLIEYFLPFLPHEMIVLIELFIVLALITGVIRLIRGH